MTAPARRLGVDTGGTFTDFVWLDGNGRLRIHKQLSTPADPSEAILAGVALLNVPESAAVVHGSTVATNALLERRGARTALITTKGFADVLAIGRQNRPDLYALVPQKPESLVPRRWRFEVTERVTAQGEILIPLELESLEPILARMESDQIESVAVCLLFSFFHPEHEQQIGRALARSRMASRGALHVSLSSEILPEYREYERTAATVINAYVAPLMSRYLENLAGGIRPRRLSVMQSNGGIISAATAASQAARTVLSGPAGGVVGARYVANRAGFADIITFDMGGTSTDAALCPGRLPATAEGEIAGMPLRLPIIDIHTVGAGGGSLAYVDAGGALHVGPQSAGAEPGPACYGREIGVWRLPVGSAVSASHLPITVTDANLVLGRLDAGHFLGGEMRLDERAARRALDELAQAMSGETPESAAWGVIQVANANMERAIRRISVERGFDPRRFTLVAFGGAGPLHACELAHNLQIPRVLIPAVPGVLSALGMLAAAPTKDYSRTIIQPLSDLGADPYEWLREQFHPLEQQAVAAMTAEGHKRDQITLRHAVDMRYLGQSHELTIPLTFGDRRIPPAQMFHTAHEKRYGYKRPEAAVEIVTLRLSAVAPVSPPSLPAVPLGGSDAADALIGEKPVWFGQQVVPARLYDRARLQPRNRFAGPAIVFQYDTTTVIPPEWDAAVDQHRNLVLTIR
ncbi:MAG: hydantoinase/oxoprolinase family protein [Anaerolineae bacterium]